MKEYIYLILVRGDLYATKTFKEAQEFVNLQKEIDELCCLPKEDYHIKVVRLANPAKARERFELNKEEYRKMILDNNKRWEV